MCKWPAIVEMWTSVGKPAQLTVVTPAFADKCYIYSTLKMMDMKHFPFPTTAGPRRVWQIALLCIWAFLAMPATRCAAQYDEEYISYDDFYQNLSPYGQWVEDPEYGYVWAPDVDMDFRPYYTNGNWVMTEYGNTWVSDYPWGWACFHYGRWTYDTYYGWLWIPGNYWGPAWVSWRYGDSFYGWAPLGPDYNPTAGLATYYCPEDWWVFIPPRYLYTGGYYRYWYGPRGNTHIIKNTTIINNTFIAHNNVTYITGPNVAHVRQVTGAPVTMHKVKSSRNFTTRIHDGVVRMYRPAEIRTTSRYSGQTPVPPGVMTGPRRVGKPQSMGDSPTPSAPPFRQVAREHRELDRTPTPGTNRNQIAEPARREQRQDNNPYEWDAASHPAQQAPPPRRRTTDDDEQPSTPKPTGRQSNPPARETPKPAQHQPAQQGPRESGRRR